MKSQLLILMLVAVVTLSCAQQRTGLNRKALAHANVLLITLDTTRADHLGPYGYKAAQTPNEDGLAREGIVFDACITPTAYTLPSHSSIMTGLYPAAHGVRINGDTALPDSNTTLAERLSAAGYRTGAFVAAFVVDGRWGLKQGFQEYDDRFHMGPDQKLDLARTRRPGNEVVDAALAWLNKSSTQPFFAWVHLYDAHAPYLDGSYDKGITFADAQVGRLLSWLDQRHLRENTIVIVVGDHGEGLGDHSELEHGYYVYDYAVHVPLIVRVPKSASGIRIPAQVRTIDIAPTIVDAVRGAGSQSAESHFEGLSLLPLIDGKEESTPRYAYSESVATRLQYGWSGLYSLRTNDYKFISAPRSELYDLRTDPKELQNKLDDERRVANAYKQELQRVRDASDKDAPKTQEANLDTETMRNLASLGYIGGTSAVVGDDKDLPDPKDKMHLFDSVGYAANLMSQDKYKDAEKVLRIVLKDDPNVPQAQLLLASTYQKLGQRDQAMQILDAYLKRDSHNVRALTAMAEILSDNGKRAEVDALSHQILNIDPRNAHAYELIADGFMAAKDYNGALPALQKAVELQPKLSRSRINLAACYIALGRTGEASTMLNQIIAEYPKFPLAHYHLALLHEREGNAAAARAEYEAELANHPKTVAARFNLGELLMKTGDGAGAERELKTLVEQDPSNARAYLILARIMLDTGRLPEAESNAAAGLAKTSANDLKALGYFVLADVYSREGRRAELARAVQMGEHYRALMN
jgi:arylsulfatase A-like enzyme/Tfp pilus assembly protein PilF